ncbi:hypothetical protein GUITHDRAFT_166378 [Guillardia theta CCMP2712]|uniref:Uncharacterized protein n=1 Tax=Guillardia theta (strain CCMP2712) TaxID=905079 RepID=L1IBZ4_GUITC|nr:hypothetical protein GUITHDRAFT_166378 [Guillardia theta CCMP2712]EKX33753.1 hypothetical protein GUITHDRAFT_166378 [Guillardia theta CCMP2712]|eukprot:XP_005820733.1 hypothetical protein GUITHDRAFT_166378 [Guillardia theta CCMP2712]
MAVDREVEDQVVVEETKGNLKEDANGTSVPGAAETAQGKVKIENIVSLLDPKNNDSNLYGAINRWISKAPVCSKLQSPLKEEDFAEVKGKLSEISIDDEGFAMSDQVVRVLQEEPLSLEQGEASQIVGYVQERSLPQRTVEVAKKNIQSLVSVAGAAKESVLVGAERASETISSQADIVSHWIVDEDRILGSRRLKQLTDVVVDPETSSKGSRVLGSRRLAGLRNFFFGPDEPADPGIISCHTFTTEAATGDSKLTELPGKEEDASGVKNEGKAGDSKDDADKDAEEEQRQDELEVSTLSENFFEEAAAVEQQGAKEGPISASSQGVEDDISEEQ